MSVHRDLLGDLHRCLPFAEKLKIIHGVIKRGAPDLTRVAVALYDDETDDLKSFAQSADDHAGLPHYHAKLSGVPSLHGILDTGVPRLVSDMAIFGDRHSAHSRLLLREGFRSSYTTPIFCNGRFAGFVFFNSRLPDAFDHAVLDELDLYGHLISGLVGAEMSTARALVATLKTTGDIAHCRDAVTGSHLKRMARYARLIGESVAAEYGLTDEFVEYLHLFAPMHDIGKVGIPDNILNKESELTALEMETMKTHVHKGLEIVDNLLTNFDLYGFPHRHLLRNIVRHHHEALDGSGYPDGLRGHDIPVEARISAVADAFDVLTSQRPYKEPWSNQEALLALEQLTVSKYDPACVRALRAQIEEVEVLQRRFSDGTSAPWTRV